jgi:hypothetical protein
MCLTTCNHGYFMKDNPETGGVMTFLNHYDWRILYDEAQMASELNLQLGYFSRVQNDNLKGIIQPDAANYETHYRLRVRMHYCTIIDAQSIGLEIKNPVPAADYSAAATSTDLQYCFPKVCAPLDLNVLEDGSAAPGLMSIMYTTYNLVGPCATTGAHCPSVGASPSNCASCTCAASTLEPNDPVQACDRYKNYVFGQRELYSQASYVCKMGYRAKSAHKASLNTKVNEASLGIVTWWGQEDGVVPSLHDILKVSRDTTVAHVQTQLDQLADAADIHNAAAEPQCYGFGVVLEGSPPFALSASSTNTLGQWSLGASTDLEDEVPLRATPTTAWTNTLTENQHRRRYQLPAKPGLATDDQNKGVLNNVPTDCLEP